MANVAQNVQRAQEGPALVEAMQQQNAVQENLEEVTRVAPAAESESESQAVKNEQQGGTFFNGGSNEGSSKRKRQTHEEGSIRESFIGQHVDITR